jgi:hypothetical protein
LLVRRASMARRHARTLDANRGRRHQRLSESGMGLRIVQPERLLPMKLWELTRWRWCFRCRAFKMRVDNEWLHDGGWNMLIDCDWLQFSREFNREKAEGERQALQAFEAERARIKLFNASGDTTVSVCEVCYSTDSHATWNPLAEQFMCASCLNSWDNAEIGNP